MREIYTAPTVEAAEARFAEFAETWRDRYPAMIATWERAWDEFVPFLEFPIELRTIVYTTNAIESLNARFRKWVRTAALPDRAGGVESALPRRHRRRLNRTNPTGKINGWKKILDALTIHYGDRIEAASDHDRHARLHNGSDSPSIRRRLSDCGRRCVSWSAHVDRFLAGGSRRGSAACSGGMSARGGRLRGRRSAVVLRW